MINTFQLRFIIFLLPLIGVLFPLPLPAAEMKSDNEPVYIEAERVSYDNLTDVYLAEGAVVITHSYGVLTADKVELDNKNNLATASGNAFLKMKTDFLMGDRIVFNINDKTGLVYRGKAFYARNHFYVRGDKIEKTGELTYRIERPAATTCDGDRPAWEISGSEMKVTIEGYGIMKDAKFTAGNVPVFYSPILPFPAKTVRQSGFLFPYLSYSRDKNGVDIEIPYFWAISETTDATFYQRLMEKRGFKQGVEFRYYLSEHSFGAFYGDFIVDTKSVQETIGTMSRDWQEERRRWSYYLNSQMDFNPQTYLRADLRRVSDNWYFRDFSDASYYRSQQARTEHDPFRKVSFTADESMRYLESTARFFKGWSDFSLNVLVGSMDDFAASSNDRTVQRYPEVTFTGIKQPLLKTPLFYEMSAIYDYFYRGDSRNGHYFDFAPAVSWPVSLSNYVKIIPQIGIRETIWSLDDKQADGDNKHGSRTLYTAGLSVSSRLFRVFDVQAQNWEKIRHEIKPEIAYLYVPNVRQNKLPDYVLPVAEQNAVNWSLTNTLTAKTKNSAGAFSYLEFLRLKLFQTYDINEAKKAMESAIAERRPFSDLGIELDVRPHRYFSFSARNTYNIYDGWKVTNYDLAITDWRNDALTVGYRYTRDSVEEINVSIKAVINKNLNGTLITRRDRLNSRTIENTVGLVYSQQCWAVGFDFSQTSSDTRFILKLSLSGLGRWGL